MNFTCLNCMGRNIYGKIMLENIKPRLIDEREYHCPYCNSNLTNILKEKFWGTLYDYVECQKCFTYRCPNCNIEISKEEMKKSKLRKHIQCKNCNAIFKKKNIAKDKLKIPKEKLVMYRGDICYNCLQEIKIGEKYSTSNNIQTHRYHLRCLYAGYFDICKYCFGDVNPDDSYDVRINNKYYWFCSEDCFNKFIEENNLKNAKIEHI